MAVGLTGLSKLLPVDGIRLSAVNAGIKQTERADVVLIEIAEGAKTAAVFTQNAFCAAPVIVAREFLESMSPRFLLINSGNANAGTGDKGLIYAYLCCESLAAAANCQSARILPFSTGVIGELLPVTKILDQFTSLLDMLSADSWAEAAHGIMTTDTVAKGLSRQIEIDGQKITVTGIAKGSGMIRPDMATMLAYIATDAALSQDLLQHCLESAVSSSFNSITIDGDTSTNDACVLMATGKSTLPEITDITSKEYTLLEKAVKEVCEYLAASIIRDGEGSTKFVTVEVFEGQSEAECREVAYTVAQSPLVKTALFASDPNWGRILAAVGRAGIANLDVDLISIYLGEVCIVRKGGRAAEYTESAGVDVMADDEITIRINLGRGDAQARIWTNDLSYDYVRINAEYRT